MAYIVEAKHLESDLSVDRQQVFDLSITAEEYRLHHLIRALMRNPDWKFYQGGLAKLSGSTRKTVRNRLRNLAKAGYLSISKTRDGKTGKYSGELWIIYGCQREELERRETGLPPEARRKDLSPRNARAKSSG